MVVLERVGSWRHLRPSAVGIHPVGGPGLDALPAAGIGRRVILGEGMAGGPIGGAFPDHTGLIAGPETGGRAVHKASPVGIHPGIPMRRIEIQMGVRVIELRVQGRITDLVTAHACQVAVILDDPDSHGRQHLAVFMDGFRGLGPELLQTRPGDGPPSSVEAQSGSFVMSMDQSAVLVP